MSVPLGYAFVFQLGWGLAGIWLAIATDEWTRGLIFLSRWRRRSWERKSLVEPEPAGAAVAAGG